MSTNAFKIPKGLRTEIRDINRYSYSPNRPSRRYMVYIKMTDDEKNALESAAKSEGKMLGNWLKNLTLHYASISESISNEKNR